MRYLILIALITFISCNGNLKIMNSEITKVNLEKEEVRKAIFYNYDFFHKNDLSDSLTFNRYKTMFSDSFVLVPSKGKPLSDKENILEEWRNLFKENEAKFNLTIHRIEVSGNMAYSLYQYDEVLTNIKTGDLYFEVTQSAIAVLRKDNFGKWKFEALRYN